MTVWIVLDIGNSSIKGGVFSGERLDHTFVLPHDFTSLAAGLDVEFDQLRRAGTEVGRVGLASVVPASRGRIAELLRSRDLAVTVVEPSMKLPFDLAYRTPETLGTDRLAAAAAAWSAYGKDAGRPVIALDAGTALTYEVIDAGGVYRGGTIAPGPALMQRALHQNTAQLPNVPLEFPASPIGGSTTEAIQAGVMYGFIDSARELLRRIRTVLGGPAHVVATGGWGRLLQTHVEEVDEVDPHLVLRGIRILMTLNP